MNLSRILTASLLVVAVSGCDRYLITAGIDDHWTPAPGTPPAGTSPPQYKWEAGTHFWRLGADGNVPGSPGSSLSTRFHCGTGHHPFCTLYINLINDLKDGERLTVSVSKGGQPVKSALIPRTGPGASQSNRLSIAGCDEVFDISFAISGGQTANVQSTVDISGVRAVCTTNDQTNQHTERGHELLNPTTGEPLRASP